MSLAKSRAKKIETDQKLPSSTDVVIIGGGILGVCTAYFLSKRGIAVTLCEKGVIAGEASCRAHGQVASAGFGATKMELLVESKRLWGSLSDAIGDGIGYRKNGYTSPCDSGKDLEIVESWFESIKHYEPEGAIVGGEEAQRLVRSEHSWAGAYHNPTDGCAEPALATSAIATAARKMGVTIVESCAVRGLECQAGRVSAVITEKGVVQTNTVVLAGGAWSMLFARSIGVYLPILNVDATCQSVAPIANGPDGTGDLPGVSWRREWDGGYSLCVIGVTVPIVPAMFRIGTKFIPTFKELGHHWELKISLGRQFLTELQTPSTWPLDKPSPFERSRISCPRVEEEWTRKTCQRIIENIPSFQGMQVRDEWAGYIVTTPDNMPTISPVNKVPGLHLLTGFNYGLTMGPGAGNLMADLITGDKPTIDPTPYRYERHIDGTKLIVVG